MPDAAPPFQPERFAGQSTNGPLTPERIERALADFRDWLANPPSSNGVSVANPNTVDLHTLVGQFIALKHEVNLQTKASRAALEQNTEVLRRLDETLESCQNLPAPEIEETDVRPMLKAMIDVYDALAFSIQQVERQKAAIQSGLATVLESTEMEPPPDVVAAEPVKQGFWQRLFGASATTASGNTLKAWRDRVILRAKEREAKVRAAVEFLNQSLDGLLTGYSMSLNRIDRALPQFGLERFTCVGEKFDPELMEVVDVVTGGDWPAGEVVEEVRRGYLLGETVFRYAQVRVAK